MANKRKAATKKAASPGGIKIDINVGHRMPTKRQKERLKQVKRLKDYVKSVVLTWVTDDIGEAAPVITCNEHNGNGNGADGDR